MKKNRGKIVVIVLSLGLALYFLYPTYQSSSFEKELASRTGDDSLQYLNEHEAEIREARAKRIKLGLDLQGGMRVVLEVDIAKMLEQIAKNKDDQF
ncbi:MAG: protein translocase subunit SecD, partial [Bacteroidota bacterium]